MKFRAYCIVVIGDTIGIGDEIKKISETEPSVIDGKGMYISTFVSASSPSELTSFFEADNRNFMVFDLNTESSGVHIMKQEIHEGLFGFLKTFNKKGLEDITGRLIHDINLTSNTETNRTEWKAPTRKRNPLPMKDKEKEKKLTISDIEKMTKTQKQGKLDEWLDKGLENLTENDKKLLELLAK